MTQIITYLILLLFGAFTFLVPAGSSEDADIVGTPDADVQEEEVVTEEEVTEEEDIVEEDEALESDEETTEEDVEESETELTLDDSITHDVYLNADGMFQFDEDATSIPTGDLSAFDVQVIEELLAAYEDEIINDMEFNMQLNHLMNIFHKLYTSSGTDYLAEAPEDAIDENGMVDASIFDIPLVEYLDTMTEGQITRFAQLENGLFLGTMSAEEYYVDYNLLLNQALRNLE